MSTHISQFADLRISELYSIQLTDTKKDRPIQFDSLNELNCPALGGHQSDSQ